MMSDGIEGFKIEAEYRTIYNRFEYVVYKKSVFLWWSRWQKVDYMMSRESADLFIHKLKNEQATIVKGFH